MRPFPVLSWCLLFASAAFSLLIESGLLVRPVPPDLERLPARLGSLAVLETVPVEPAALGEQPPERHAFRRVLDADGHEGRLFVAYYRRAQRWSGRPHDVDRCFAALGWEEREARQLEGEHRPWSRLFEREGERIRVVHWLERPGRDSRELGPGSLLARLADGTGFRPDVCSVYLQFDEGAAPDEAELAEAVETLSAAIDGLW